MATPRVKGTYTLDLATVEALDRLTRRWGVSKSAALRRALTEAAASAGAGGEALRVWDELQKSVRLTTQRAERWVREIGQERRASAKRRLGRRA